MYPNWSIDLQDETGWAMNLREFTYNSILIPGPETDRIGEAAREKGVYVVVGANEVEEIYDGALFNSLVFIGPMGEVLGKHCKLFPSNREKVFHARGDASGLNVYDTSVGRLGGLICYEHLQPLLKYALTSQGEQVHCAAWVARVPERPVEPACHRRLLQGSRARGPVFCGGRFTVRTGLGRRGCGPRERELDLFRGQWDHQPGRRVRGWSAARSGGYSLWRYRPGAHPPAQGDHRHHWQRLDAPDDKPQCGYIPVFADPVARRPGCR